MIMKLLYYKDNFFLVRDNYIFARKLKPQCIYIILYKLIMIIMHYLVMATNSLGIILKNIQLLTVKRCCNNG